MHTSSNTLLDFKFSDFTLADLTPSQRLSIQVELGLLSFLENLPEGALIGTVGSCVHPARLPLQEAANTNADCTVMVHWVHFQHSIEMTVGMAPSKAVTLALAVIGQKHLSNDKQLHSSGQLQCNKNQQVECPEFKLYAHFYT